MSATDGYPAETKPNGMAVASLVCSIVGIFLLGVVLGPLGIIFGGIGLQRANRGGGRRGIAVTGLTIGIIDVALYMVLLLAATSSGWHV